MCICIHSQKISRENSTQLTVVTSGEWEWDIGIEGRRSVTFYFPGELEGNILLYNVKNTEICID